MSKLTREDKIKIYERRKNGETIPSLAKAFNVQESNIKYLIALIKKHGYNILREDKNRVYTDIGYASVERNDEVYPLGSILPDLITEVQNDPKYQDYLK